VHITHWQDDPFSLGSYAHMTVGATTADHDDLATPIGGVLYLAGEATWTDDPATVAAAMFSGHRAAERVLEHGVPIAELWADS
jgi:monoamine oxidase